jgi:hypothetical protein
MKAKHTGQAAGNRSHGGPGDILFVPAMECVHILPVPKHRNDNTSDIKQGIELVPDVEFQESKVYACSCE